VDNGEDAVREAARLLPDVILLDLSLPRVDGLKVAQLIKRDYPKIRVLLLSEQDSDLLSRLAESAGTPYYVPKSRLAFELIPMLTSLAHDFTESG
jgi:DNA-binding NarL/FixJ family response regulator